MAEYIEREALLKATEKMDRLDKETKAPYEYDKEGWLLLIQNAPAADVVEVVRCKDCKDYSSVMFCGKPTHYGYCCNTHDSVLGNRHRFENDFCSYGAKMDGKGEGE